MTNQFNYAFDDEYVSKFCYDIDNKKMELYYSAYYDLQNNDTFIEKACVFIIKNWDVAKSCLGAEERFYDLKKHLGIITIIYSMILKDETLEMFVDTVGGKCITLIFTNPELEFRELL